MVGKVGLPPLSFLSYFNASSSLLCSSPHMAREWSNRNLPGALHFVTGNIIHRHPVFKQRACCEAFLDICTALRREWPFKLIAYVLMPDHVHLIVNPKDGRIRELMGVLKSRTAQEIIAHTEGMSFLRDKPDPDRSIRQVWQESFKALPLWSAWMIWQKINYIHANPLKARLVKSARDYRWSSFKAVHLDEAEPIEIDKDWWWPDDVQKLAKGMAEWSKEMEY